MIVLSNIEALHDGTRATKTVVQRGVDLWLESGKSKESSLSYLEALSWWRANRHAVKAGQR